jgi:hypothetical protein
LGVHHLTGDDEARSGADAVSVKQESRSRSSTARPADFRLQVGRTDKIMTYGNSGVSVETPPPRRRTAGAD